MLSMQDVLDYCDLDPGEIEAIAEHEHIPMTLAAEDADGHTVTAAGAVPEAARNRALTAEEVEARLKKTGGTAFSVASCSVSLDDGLAALAGWRADHSLR